MRRTCLILPFVLAVLVAGCGGGSGEEERNKATLLEHVEERLDAAGAPEELSTCLVKQIDSELTNQEVERAYESIAGNSDPSDSEVAQAIGPSAVRAFARSGVVCGRVLIQSGKFTPIQVERMFRSLKE
jgi:hypothetical protein